MSNAVTAGRADTDREWLLRWRDQVFEARGALIRERRMLEARIQTDGRTGWVGYQADLDRAIAEHTHQWLAAEQGIERMGVAG